MCVGILHGYVNKRLSNIEVLLFELILFTVTGCYTKYRLTYFVELFWIVMMIDSISLIFVHSLS